MLNGLEAVARGLTRRVTPFSETLTIKGRRLTRCLVCERKCLLAEGLRGLCGNRVNEGGKLVVDTYGLLSAVERRPIEIKPLYHYWPGSSSLTYSGWGCSFRCPWCQNYHLSWSKPMPQFSVYIPPEELALLAKKLGDEGICASFNEPGVHLEYVVDASREARKLGLYSTMVTNAYFTRRALDELIDAGVDGFSVDLKGCPSMYKRILSADPEVVLRNARYIIDSGGHVEIVFLVVTGANDSDECIKWVIDRVVDRLGPETPLHINRYYPANKWRKPATKLEILKKAYDYAKKQGLEYVYIGNISDPEYSTTRCPRCGKVLIRRVGYYVSYYNVTRDGRCPRCGYKINLKGKPVLKPPVFERIF